MPTATKKKAVTTAKKIVTKKAKPQKGTYEALLAAAEFAKKTGLAASYGRSTKKPSHTSTSKTPMPYSPPLKRAFLQTVVIGSTIVHLANYARFYTLSTANGNTYSLSPFQFASPFVSSITFNGLSAAPTFPPFTAIAKNKDENSRCRKKIQHQYTTLILLFFFSFYFIVHK